MSNRKIALGVLTVILSLFSISVVSAAYGTNWSAEYFDNATLQGAPVYTETLPNGININWGTSSPSPSVPVDNFSARFTSTQTFNAGTYEFILASEDGVRVFVDGLLVWDRFVGRTLTTDRFDVSLTAGPHEIVIEYLELVDQAAIQFQYFLISSEMTEELPGIGIPAEFTFTNIRCDTPIFTEPGGQPVGSAFITAGQTWFVNPRPVEDREGRLWTELFNGGRTNGFIPTDCVGL
ncbi:MAG: hypothetical protein IPO91_07985 [Chloroflexi bacterium]|nr:hypothetical protein [Chloroflexota bacterium]